MLRSNSSTYRGFSPADHVAVFMKREREKRGKRPSSRAVLSTDCSIGLDTFPGLTGRLISVPIEVVGHFIARNDSADRRRESDNLQEACLEVTLDELEVLVPNQPVSVRLGLTRRMDSNTVFFNAVAFTTSVNHITESCTPPSIGDRVEIFWALDESYYPGTVTGTDSDCKHFLSYNDKGIQNFDLTSETWRPCDTLESRLAFFHPFSLTRRIAYRRCWTLSTKLLFCFIVSRVFHNLMPSIYYEAEELEIQKDVKLIFVSKVPSDENFVPSYTNHKLSIFEDDSLLLKAPIAVHGNKDRLRHGLRSDCSMGSPDGMYIVMCLAAFRHWHVIKAGWKAVIWQTGDSKKSVFVRPPRESKDRRHYCLSLAAAYGPVNANGKC